MINNTVISSKKTSDSTVILAGMPFRINFANIDVIEYIFVDDAIVSRMDIVSKVLYGTHDFVDILTKFNKIHNPMQIKEGDVLAIPNLSQLFENVQNDDIKSIIQPHINRFSTQDTSTRRTPAEAVAISRVKANDKGIIIF